MLKFIDMSQKISNHCVEDTRCHHANSPNCAKMNWLTNVSNILDKCEFIHKISMYIHSISLTYGYIYVYILHKCTTKSILFELLNSSTWRVDCFHAQFSTNKTVFYCTAISAVLRNLRYLLRWPAVEHFEFDIRVFYFLYGRYEKEWVKLRF